MIRDGGHLRFDALEAGRIRERNHRPLQMWPEFTLTPHKGLRTMSMFTPAKRYQLKLRMALCGPSGSGKSYSALRFAFALGAKVAAIDTEHGALSKYQGLNPDGVPWHFDVLELSHYAPTNYTAAIKEAGRLGYDAIIIDSLSHAWEGAGGALDQIDKKGGNKFTAWKDVTPQHRGMVDAILGAPLHVIATMRTKTEYVLETNEKGKSVPVKVGTQPVQRAGMEYEFDVVADMDLSHVLTVSKTRCPAIDQEVVSQPSAHWLTPVVEWLGVGRAVEAPKAKPESEPKPEPIKEPEPSPSTTATAEQVAQIKGLVQRAMAAGLTKEEFVDQWLAGYQAMKIADLHGTQAVDCIAKLNMYLNSKGQPLGN